MKSDKNQSVMTGIILSLLLFFAATPALLQAKDPATRYKVTNGTIISFDTTAKLIIVNNHKGQDTIALTGKTIFSHFSTPIPWSNFKTDDRVTVHYINKSGNLSARRVVLIGNSGRGFRNEQDAEKTETVQEMQPALQEPQ